MQANHYDEAKRQHQPPGQAIADWYNADAEGCDAREQGVGYLCGDVVHEVAAGSKAGQDGCVRDGRTVICPHGTSQDAGNTGI